MKSNYDERLYFHLYKFGVGLLRRRALRSRILPQSFTATKFFTTKARMAQGYPLCFLRVKNSEVAYMQIASSPGINGAALIVNRSWFIVSFQ
jgi:hypothetical protein